MYLEVGFMIYGPNIFLNYTAVPHAHTHTHTLSLSLSHTHTHTFSLTMNSTAFHAQSKFIGSRQIFVLYTVHVHSEIQHIDCVEVFITFHLICAVDRV